ncbi:RNA polymerase sigma factor [Candidatus Zixiibacteriota bacterium]
MDGSPTDEEVVAQCLAGETDSFAIIVRRYQARFLRLATGSLGDRATAQDVVQETFIHAYTKLDRWAPQAKFSGWLYTVFSNCLIDFLRKRQRYGGFLSRLTDFYRHEPQASEPETPPPDTSWVRPALARLSKKQRLCVLLRDIEQMEIPAIAEQLSVDKTTVRVHLLRGRRKLREIYEREIKPS